MLIYGHFESCLVMGKMSSLCQGGVFQQVPDFL